MGLSQQELVEGLATITLYDGKLTINYRPEEDATGEETAAIMDVTVSGYAEAGVRALCRVMARVVESWDLLDAPESEGGKPYPLDEETLYTLVNSRLLNKIYVAIQEDRSLGEPTASVYSKPSTERNGRRGGRSISAPGMPRRGR